MRKGGDRRGSNVSRKRRKVWMLATFDVELGPDECRCHLGLSDRCLGILGYAEVTPDRIVLGSGYSRDAIRPACRPCQSLQGALVSQGRWPVGVSA